MGMHACLSLILFSKQVILLLKNFGILLLFSNFSMSLYNLDTVHIECFYSLNAILPRPDFGGNSGGGGKH